MSHLKEIGRGHFTTVYRKDRYTVLLKSRDKVKECMSMGWFPETHLFPKVKRVTEPDASGYSMYEMKHLKVVRAPRRELTEEHYKLYQELRTLGRECCSDANHLRDSIHELNVNRTIKEHLLDAVSALTNYGNDVCFEISPRNVAVSSTGKLILMDVFFFKNDLSWNK